MTDEKDALTVFTPLKVVPDELRLEHTLICGQCFQWRPLQENEWIGVIGSTLFVLRQTETDIYFALPLVKHILMNNEMLQGASSTLREYFQLDTPGFGLVENIKKWVSADVTGYMNHCSRRLRGLRLLRLDPLEALLSFICSSNNNMVRIHSLVDKLRQEYGTYLGTFKEVKYYSFPSLAQIQKTISVDRLKALGFGYRAKYLHATVNKLNRMDGEKFLQQLRDDKTISSAQKAATLEKLFMGVGPKVANLVALQSLDCFDCIPIDVHIYRTFTKIYQPNSKPKSKTGSVAKIKTIKATVTDKEYKNITNVFQSMFGPLCGWTQLLLFANATR
jgi:N-glycosylase/DNA lyase